MLQTPLKKLFIKPLITLVSILIVFVGLSYLHAAWQGPTQTAPQGNVPAPVNVGNVTQSKNGNLAVDTLAAFTEVRSDRYCDSLGQICTDFQPVCKLGEVLFADGNGGWTCGAITGGGGGTANLLVNGQNNFARCTALGGTVTTDAGGNNFCRFSSSCPSGWSPYGNWGTYSPGRQIDPSGRSQSCYWNPPLPTGVTPYTQIPWQNPSVYPTSQYYCGGTTCGNSGRTMACSSIVVVERGCY